MLLPYATTRRPTRQPIVTLTLMTVQAVITLTLLVFGRPSGPWSLNRALEGFGIVPANFHLWTLLTYSFLHLGLAHLLTNLFYLWVFGASVEAAVGPKRFLLIYLAGGAFGGALQAMVTYLMLPPLFGQTAIVGASAACYTLMGVFAVRFYRTRLTFVPFPRTFHVVTIVTLFLGLEIVAALWRIATGSEADGIAHWAHIGGFIFGLVWAQWAHLADAAELDYRGEDARAMDNRSPGAALRQCEAILLREPNNITAHIESARAWMVLGDTEQAGKHYLAVLRLHLTQRRPGEAARLYATMRHDGLPLPDALRASELAHLGSALEESEYYDLAAETLRAIPARYPDAPEAEMAMIKVIGLYIHKLFRREEANALIADFIQRYPNSPWRAQVETLR